MTAPLPPILVGPYPMPETDAERRDRIKRGEAARTYSFMVVTIKEDEDERNQQQLRE